MNVAELRQEYMRAGLSEVDADRDPVRQFEHWLEDALRRAPAAAQRGDACHCVRSGHTRRSGGAPEGVERGGFVFYTNYRSRKGRELDARAAACLVFLWPDLERQVRVEGSVEKLSAGESDAYFATRPLGAGSRPGPRRRASACRTAPRWRPPWKKPVGAMASALPGRRTGAATGDATEHRVLAGSRRPAARPSALYARRRRWRIERLAP